MRLRNQENKCRKVARMMRANWREDYIFWRRFCGDLSFRRYFCIINIQRKLIVHNNRYIEIRKTETHEFRTIHIGGRKQMQLPNHHNCTSQLKKCLETRQTYTKLDISSPYD